MLPIKCPAIPASQTSRGQLQGDPTLAGIMPDFWPHIVGIPHHKLSAQGCSERSSQWSCILQN
eukprot:1136527-Pelagomonas_calceolata.AAC.3